MPTISNRIMPDRQTVFRFNEGLLRQMVNKCIDDRMDEIVDNFRDVVRSYVENDMPKSEFMKMLGEVGK